MTTAINERRHFSRISFDCLTTINQAGKQWSTSLIDISLKGLLVAVPAQWDADDGQVFEVDIALADDTTISMTVNCRHSNDDQLGFECQHIDIDSISHLRRLVELNIGDSDLLERELAALGK
ncbi:MAG: hypothetical protein ACJAYG_000708 [Oceanicoccus sp.]|jgi:hypothetical protein